MWLRSGLWWVALVMAAIIAVLLIDGYWVFALVVLVIAVLFFLKARDNIRRGV